MPASGRFVVSRFALSAALAALLGATACSDHDHGPGADHDHAEAAEGPEPWAVTAWGDLYEIFPEVDPLVAGRAAESHTHVTTLADFSPLTEGDVAIVLRAADGTEEVFRAERAKRPGIFGIAVTPARAGEFELLFRVDAAAGREEIPGGRVRVGTADDPGGLIEQAAPTVAAERLAAERGGEEISFLKEQQWKTPFATAWAAEGELAATRVAPARVVARPGGDRLLTAPADGIVGARPFPHPGLAARAGATLFTLTPRLDPEQSLADLEGELASAEAELALATVEAERSRKLAEGGLVPDAERDHDEAELAVARARAEAARRDVETARRARGGAADAAEALAVRAPFDGAVAEVVASAGQAVEAGDVLGRFVTAGPPWIHAWLEPGAAASLASGPTRVSVSTGADGSAPLATGIAAEIVAIAPTLHESSGRRTVLIALAAELPALAVGQSVEVEIEAGAPLRGLVIPASAVVDDAGVTVVYVQVSGETVLRREVDVVARAGDRRLVTGITPGERVVTIGGAAIRRASMVSSGVGEAHVH